MEKSISLRNVQHHFTLWSKNLNEIYIWWTNQRKYLGISWRVLLFMYNVCVLFTKLRSCDPHAIIIGFLYCQHQSSNFFFAKYIIRQVIPDICNLNSHLYVQRYIFLASIHSIFWVPGNENYLCISTLLASYILCIWILWTFLSTSQRLLYSNRLRAISGIFFLCLSPRILKLMRVHDGRSLNCSCCMWHRKYTICYWF